jgi:uncharacterized protein YkwD
MPVSATNLPRPRRVLARTVLFGISTILAAGMLASRPAETTGWDQSSAEATLWQLLNGARTNNGLAPLQQHGTLVSLARWRSADMLQRDYFSHTIPGCGCLVYTYYDSNGLKYSWAGENIGWNSGLTDTDSPIRVHEAFMASPGHRANVLDARFTQGGVGAGAVDGQMFQGYVQNTRMYTELFMQPKVVAPAPTPAPAPPAPAPAPAPTPRPPSSGGASTRPAAPAAPAATVAPQPVEVAVATPARPASAAGLDGVTTLVVGSDAASVAARLAVDDALGIWRSASDGTLAAPASEQATPGGMQVAAASAPEPGLLDGIVAAVLDFLFG